MISEHSSEVFRLRNRGLVGSLQTLTLLKTPSKIKISFMLYIPVFQEEPELSLYSNYDVHKTRQKPSLRT